MIREVHEFGLEESELQTHLVGLEPRHSANAPDAWEADALKRLAEGEPEVSSERSIRGKLFFRTMRPLFVEESCLKCHAEQGYHVGELRGGISISMPFAPLWPMEKAELLRSIVRFGGMWLFGLCSILFGARHLRHQIEKRIAIEKELRKEKVNDCGRSKFRIVSFQRSRLNVQGSILPGRRFADLPAATNTITSLCPKRAQRSLSALSPGVGLLRIAHGNGAVHSAVHARTSGDVSGS